MAPEPWFTVQLEPIRPHPETTLDSPGVRFCVPCWWMPQGRGKLLEWKAVLATDLVRTVIPRFVYDRVKMRIDELSEEPHASWQGHDCFVGTVRFGLPADERPR